MCLILQVACVVVQGAISSTSIMYVALLPVFSSRGFRDLGIIFNFQSILSWLLYKRKIPISTFFLVNASFPTLFVKQITFSPFCVIGTFVKEKHITVVYCLICCSLAGQYILKLGVMKPLAWFNLTKIALAVSDVLWFHGQFIIVFSISIKMYLGSHWRFHWGWR